jgi:hypothetical protein
MINHEMSASSRDLFLVHFPYFEKMQVGIAIFMLSVFLCILSYHLLNGWTSLYKTRYVYHDTWARLNRVLHKSLPSVCLSTWASHIVARQRFTAATNIHATIKLLDSSFSMQSVSYQGRYAIISSPNFLSSISSHRTQEIHENSVSTTECSVLKQQRQHQRRERP